MKWGCSVLRQCSFQHNSTTHVFCDLYSSSLACLGWGIGHPLASAVSTDCAAGACWSHLDCSKFCRRFPGSKDSLVPWGSSRGWRMRLVEVVQRPVPHLWHFFICVLLSWSLLLVDSAWKLELAMVRPEFESWSSAEWQGSDSLSLACSGPLSSLRPALDLDVCLHSLMGTSLAGFCAALSRCAWMCVCRKLQVVLLLLSVPLIPLYCCYPDFLVPRVLASQTSLLNYHCASRLLVSF